MGGSQLTPAGALIRNPAFDVTPHQLIAGIITERGIFRAPYTESLKRAFESEAAVGSYRPVPHLSRPTHADPRHRNILRRDVGGRRRRDRRPCDGRGPSASNVIASQVPIHREWGGVVPELASRQHIRDICGVVERALDEAEHDVERSGRRCRHAGPRPRGIAARRRVVRQGGGRGRPAAAGRRASPGRPHRVAGAAERRAAASGRRPRRIGRPHQPVPRREAGPISAAQPDARRCGRRGVRQGREAARSGISGRTRHRPACPRRQRPGCPPADDAADPRRSERAAAEGRPRLQLQRAQDSRFTPRASGPGRDRPTSRRLPTSARVFNVSSLRLWSSARSMPPGAGRPGASVLPAASRPTADCERISRRTATSGRCPRSSRVWRCRRTMRR